MKIKTDTSKKRIISISVIVLVLLIAGGTVYGLTRRTANTATDNGSSESAGTHGTIDNQPAGDAEIDAGASAKQNTADQQASGQPSGDTTITVQNVSAYNSGSTVQVSVNITSSLDTGTCILTLAKDSVVRQYTADVQFSGTYTTCKGFTVPVSDLSSGTWTIDLVVTSGARKGQGTATVTVA